MKTLLLIFFLLLVTTSVFAEWKFYDLSKSGGMNYYDNSSISRNGDKVKVMHYANFSQDDELTKLTKMSSARVLYEIDRIFRLVGISW